MVFFRLLVIQKLSNEEDGKDVGVYQNHSEKGEF